MTNDTMVFGGYRLNCETCGEKTLVWTVEEQHAKKTMQHARKDSAAKKHKGHKYRITHKVQAAKTEEDLHMKLDGVL